MIGQLRVSALSKLCATGRVSLGARSDWVAEERESMLSTV